MASTFRLTLLSASLATLTFCSSVAANERLLHRSVLADGSTVYSDAPVPGARSVSDLRVEPHSPDPHASAQAQAALQQRRAAMLRDFQVRQARVAEIDRNILAADDARELARRDQQRASAIRDGDRQGRHFTAQYLQRQADAAAAEELAARRLAALQQARAGLSP